MSKRRKAKRKAREAPGDAPTDAAGQPRVRVVAIMVVYVILGLYMALTVGVGRPPDEGAHLEYVRALTRDHRLPVFTADEANYEAHQPPLYYALGAAAMVVSGGSPHAVRVISLLLGLLVIWTTYRLASAMDLLGEPAVAVTAAAVVAFLPMHVAVMSAVSNDSLTEAVFGLGMLGAVLGLKTGFTRKKAALLGVIMGLGLLSKNTCVLLVPVVLLAFFLDGRRRREPLRELALNSGMALAVALAVGGWWLWRNLMLYGDPLAAGRFEEVFKVLGRPGPEFFASRGFSSMIYWELVVYYTLLSFWGVSGPMSAWRAGPSHWAMLVLSVVALVGLVRFGRGFIRDPDRGPWTTDAVVTLLVVCALTLALFLQFNTVFFQAQGRYLYPMLPVVALGFTVGWASLFPAKVRAGPVLGLSGLVLVLCLSSVAVWT